DAVILVDTNVFVDVWSHDPTWAAWSEQMLARAAEAGPLAVNPIIYAELCLGFEEESGLDETLADAGIKRLPLPYQATWPAARAFAAYRKRGGRRHAPLPDFFIGAHAVVEGLTLLTRDPRRYRTYFPELRLIAPA
ncbi:MAG TPA: type II toxin-antitoxin system VapC family toxin, partial [Vicinamibacteria bacterium]|nr:type II toxin-antitoxin system VapC family toxin [Vicinamibacteria bacterium]